MRKLLLCAAAMALFGGFATEVRAQDPPPTTADATVTLTVGDLLFVSVDNAAIDFDPGQTEFDLGVMGGVSNNVTTKGNIDYLLQIQAAAADFTYDGLETPPAKPSTDFSWKTSAGAAYTPLTVAAQPVQAFTPGQAVTPMDYEIDLDWAEDLEGEYTLDITYSVVPN
ncbi:MAG: hypothetical protein P8125_13660 [Gemmatimonadota bacterium]|jgi:hypothetical protein